MRTSALVMYARPPILGQVKTRLQPAYSAAEALALYEAMLADCVERIVRAAVPGHPAAPLVPFTPFLSWSGPCEPAAGLREMLGSIQMERQTGADLGERMASTIQGKLAAGFRQIVIVGSDAPSLPPVYLAHAFDALGTADVVIGPAADGGYYLIGARRLHPRLFQKMPWGTGDVLKVTRKRLKEGKVSCHELPVWYDVDTPSDVARLWKDLRAMKAAGSPDLPSRTWKTLAAMSHRSPT